MKLDGNGYVIQGCLCEHLQEQIVDLEPNGQQDVDTETRPKSWVSPVVGWLRYVVSRHYDSSPEPPGALESDDCPE